MSIRSLIYSLVFILLNLGIRPMAASAEVDRTVLSQSSSNLNKPRAVHRTKKKAEQELLGESITSKPVPLPPPLAKVPRVPAVLRAPVLPKNHAWEMAEQARMIEEMNRVKKQLDAILKMNQTLQAQYGNQAQALQRISEQAKIHQKILESIKPSQLKHDVITKEKIKVIQEETDHNQDFINHLKDQKTVQKS